MAEGSFWDKRFEQEGAMWGMEPSESAIAAARLFYVWEVKRVLVPGCAYGRHCLYFARQGFEVIGLDSSPVALDMARKSAADRGLSIDFLDGDATRIPLSVGDVDAIYDRALLHLLLSRQRRTAVAEYQRVLRPDGILFAVYFSDQDPECGRGVEVEPGTFDAKGGRPAHFFTEAELRAELADFHISVLRLTDETEMHGNEVHEHKFWQMIAERQ